MTTPLTTEQQRIKDDFVRMRGDWADHWEVALRLDPEFMRAYLDLSTVPWKKNHLDAKTKTLIYLAVDAAATHQALDGRTEPTVLIGGQPAARATDAPRRAAPR